MFCNYPVALPFYLAAVALLLLAVFPRCLESAAKSRVFWLLGAVVFIAGMILLPSRNHLLGDGLTHLANPGRFISYTEPLELMVHRVFFLLVGDSLLSYRIVAFVAGLGYLYGIYLTARLAETWIEKSITALAFICLGTIQFYFGYVEHYTLLSLFALFYIYAAWRDMRDNKVTQLPLLFFLLAFVSHLSAIVLLPSLFYLYQTRFRKWLILLAILIVVAGIVAAIAVDFRKVLVPLFASDFSDYTLFSSAHLLDLLMILLLICPAFFLAFWRGRWDRRMIFTLIALAGSLCFTIAIDPKIGALRDWDLLSIFAIPSAALVALRAPRHRLTIAILLVLITARIVPWIVFNSQPQNEFVKQQVLTDAHYSSGYDRGLRLSSWGLLLYKLGDWQGAKESWQKELTYAPDRLNTLSMLAPLQFKLKEYPEAYRSYLRMLQLQPNNPEYRYRSAYLLFRMGNNRDATTMLYGGPPEFRENPTTRRLMAGILAATGRHQEAVAIIEQTPIEDADAYLPYVLAQSCLTMNRHDLARSLITRALQLDPDNNDYRKLADRIPK